MAKTQFITAVDFRAENAKLVRAIRQNNRELDRQAKATQQATRRLTRMEQQSRQTAQALGELSSAQDRVNTTLQAAAGAVLAVATGELAQYGAELKQVADATDLSIQQYQAWLSALQGGRVEYDDVRDAFVEIALVQRRLAAGDEDMIKLARQTGLAWRDTAGQIKQGQAFVEAYFTAIAQGAGRSQEALEKLMSEGGIDASLQSLFQQRVEELTQSSQTLSTAVAQAGRQSAQISEEAAENIARVDRQLQALAQSAKAAFVEGLGQNAQAIEATVSQITGGIRWLVDNIDLVVSASTTLLSVWAGHKAAKMLSVAAGLAAHFTVIGRGAKLALALAGGVGTGLAAKGALDSIGVEADPVQAQAQQRNELVAALRQAEAEGNRRAAGEIARSIDRLNRQLGVTAAAERYRPIPPQDFVFQPQGPAAPTATTAGQAPPPEALPPLDLDVFDRLLDPAEQKLRSFEEALEEDAQALDQLADQTHTLTTDYEALWAAGAEARTRAIAEADMHYAILQELEDQLRREAQVAALVAHAQESIAASFADVVSGARSARQAIDDLRRELVRMAALAVFRHLVGAAAGGPAGAFLAGLAGPQRFADGGHAAPGAAWVGERGRELVVFPRDARVVSAEALRQMQAAPPAPAAPASAAALGRPLQAVGRELEDFVRSLRATNAEALRQMQAAPPAPAAPASAAALGRPLQAVGRELEDFVRSLRATNAEALHTLPPPAQVASGDDPPRLVPPPSEPARRPDSPRTAPKIDAHVNVALQVAADVSAEHLERAIEQKLPRITQSVQEGIAEGLMRYDSPLHERI